MADQVDTSIYTSLGARPVPQQPPANLLELANTATTMRANAAVAQTRERELEKQRVLGEIMQSARDSKGNFDMGSVATRMLAHPLTASEAPEYMKQALQMSGMKGSQALQQLELAKEKQELIARAAAGALEGAVPGADGSLGLGMEHVTRGLAQLKNSIPGMGKQVDSVLESVSKMNDSERYRAVQQAGYMGLTAAQGLDKIGNHVKTVTTEGSDGPVVLGIDTRRPNSPAQVLYQGQGKPMVVPQGSDVLSHTGKEVLRKGSGLDPKKEAEVEMYVGQGLHPTIARGIAYGDYKPFTDPVTGERAIMDVKTGKKVDYSGLIGKMSANRSNEAVVVDRFSPIEPQIAQQTTPRAGPDLYGTASAETGLVPKLKELATGIVPQATDALGMIPGAGAVAGSIKSLPGVGGAFNTFENTVEQRQDLRLAQNELLRGLAQNPRFSEGEQKRLSKEIDIEPNVWDSQTSLQARMRSVDRGLRSRLEKFQQDRNNPEATLDMKKHAEESISTINQFLKKLNVPQGASASGSKPVVGGARIIPPAAISRLREKGSDPKEIRHFDEVFGSGAAERVLRSK